MNQVDAILEMINNLPPSDREILEKKLAEQLEEEWRKEAEIARGLAKDKGIDESAISADSLKARLRNSYRAIKREGSPNPLWSTWDHSQKRNFYKMESVVRDEILCL